MKQKVQVNADGSRKKPIQFFDEHNYLVKVAKLTKEAKKLSELIKLLREVTGDKEVTTLGAFNDWLCKSAGFKSPSFSSEALDLKDAYENAHRLSNEIDSLTIKDLTPMHKLSKTLLDRTKEEFTTYYSDHRILTDVLLFNRLVEQFDSLPYDFKKSVIVNREGKLLSRIADNYNKYN
jgi:hypothetical protein